MQVLKAICIIILFSLSIKYIWAIEDHNQTSWLASYIENKFSAPDREVKLEGVSGLLSSDVSIKKLTISDSKGAWLIANNLSLSWDRSALLSDTLQIDKLQIDSIKILRKSIKSHNLISELISLSKLNLSSLPVNMDINKLKINKIYLYKKLAGVEETLSTNGYFKFNNYNLDTLLQINSTNRQTNGYLNIHYNNKINNLNVDFNIKENNGGIIAKLLRVKNKALIQLKIEGGGTPNNLSLRLNSNIGKIQALQGFFNISNADIITSAKAGNTNISKNIHFKLEGPVHDFVPARYKEFFRKYSSISANAVITPDHTIHINEFIIDGSAFQAQGSALMLPDGFLRNLFFKAKLFNFNNSKEPTLGAIEVKYGINNSKEWQATLQLNNKKRNITSNVKMFGIADHLDDPTQRHVTLNLDGNITQNSTLMALNGKIDLRSSAPILIKQLALVSKHNNINVSGIIDNKIFNGFTNININNLNELGSLFKKSWQGQINLAGKTYISSNYLSQTINGSVNQLYIDSLPQLNKWFKNFTTLNGDIDYSIDKTRQINLQNVSINNKDISAKFNGFVGYNETDFITNIEHINLNLINEHLIGTSQGILVSKGHNGIIINGANLASDKLVINDETFLNNNVKLGLIAIGLDKFKPIYKGFLNLNSENKKQKINLKLQLDGEHNCEFSARHVPLSILQPFSKIKLPLVKFDAAGNIDNNIVNFTINTKQNDVLLNAKGTYDIKKTALNSEMSGQIDSKLLNERLATKQMESFGFIKYNLKSNGTLKNPNIVGTLTTTNGNFIDSKHNIKLNNIDIVGNVKGYTINFTHGTANIGASGKVTALGAIDFKDIKNPIINLNLNLLNIPYNQGLNFSTVYSGNLKLIGPILDHPKLSGNVQLLKALILISRNINANTPLKVKHINSTAPIINTLQRAHMQTIKKEPIKTNNIIYDVNITSPNHLFVKGMGADIEMQGGIHVSGQNNDLHSIGSFKMIKGHINLLSHYFNFDKGDISLNGDIKPFLSFSANTNADNNLTVTVKLEGYIDDIKVNFTSSPPLPEDEILAQLLFHRSVKQLSAFQLAKIITTLSNLSGSNSFFNSLQSAATLENINIDSDENGDIGISAGRYLTKNMYTSFGATQKGTTKASINWDLPHNLKATGQYQSNNQNNVGLYYSHDY